MLERCGSGSGKGFGFTEAIMILSLGCLLWVNSGGYLVSQEQSAKPSLVMVSVNGIEQSLSLANSDRIDPETVGCVHNRAYRLYSQDILGKPFSSFILCCPPGEQPRCEILKWH